MSPDLQDWTPHWLQSGGWGGSHGGTQSCDLQELGSRLGTEPVRCLLEQAGAELEPLQDQKRTLWRRVSVSLFGPRWVGGKRPLASLMVTSALLPHRQSFSLGLLSFSDHRPF